MFEQDLQKIIKKLEENLNYLNVKQLNLKNLNKNENICEYVDDMISNFQVSIKVLKKFQI